MSQIAHVVVVGFHHKKGCQVEYSYPPLNGAGDGGLPNEWNNLPSLALPDGAHNLISDVIYFTLPSLTESGKTVFGISCFRQIPASDLVAKTDDVTRSTVQKCVCVISRTPLFGVLKAKLQLITQAYFNERDFSKVEVLSQMYSNLCEMFEGDLVDGQAASMDISVQQLFHKYRHRVLLLFKLILLERKVIFSMQPVQDLGDTIIALLSLFPKLLEEGLFYSVSGEPPVEGSETLSDVIENKDSYGFPLSIYTKGNVFHPYQSIGYLDHIRSPKIRAFTIGATNALFLTKRDLLDVIITADDSNLGQIEIINPDLKKILTLTSADLRFCDFIMKNIEYNQASSAVFEGGDEWIRLQFRGYLLGLASSARSDLQTAIADYSAAFVNEWKTTVNYRLWMAGKHPDLSGAVPGHVFSGQIGLQDVILRVDSAVSSSENARKAMNAIANTGKSIGERGSIMKQSISQWFKSAPSSAETEKSDTESNGNQETHDQRGEKELETSTTSTGFWFGGPHREELGNKAKNLMSWLKSSKEPIEIAQEGLKSPSEASTSETTSK